MLEWFRSRPKLSIFLGVISVLIILLIVLAYKSFSLQETFTPDPAESYQEAMARIQEMQAEEAEIPNLSQECQSILMTHEDQVDKAIVFLHGFTSCPD